MATLHELITKVIPLKGILRTPSYWMRKVLTAIADAVEAVHTELDGKVEAVHTELDGKVEAVHTELVSTSDKLTLKGDSLGRAILYTKTGQPFFILDAGTKMIIDGKVIDAEPYTVYKAKSLLFKDDTFSATSVDFLISLNIPAISFNNCTGLTSLDVSNFDTSAVTQMNSMFDGCTALRNIKCKQAFKDWCVANASTIGLTVANITWEIVQ